MRFLSTCLISTVSALALISCGGGEVNKAVSDTKAAMTADAIPHAQLPETVIPQNYRLDMRMDPDAHTMSGRVEIDVDITKATTKIWLHGKNMTVPSATVTYENGDAFDVTFTELSAEDAPSGIAHLTSDKTLPKGKAVIAMDYETPYNQSLNSAYQVKRGDDAYIVTQFEPLGAREAFPSFDEPKYKVPFTLSITAPKDDVVISNTPETSATETDDGWIKHDFATTRPLPTYLIAFAAGPYDVVDYGDIPANDVRSRPLKLRGLAAKGSGDQLNYALENTDGILSAMEGYFGTEYPYEKLDLIAAPDYAFGAMENPGAIVYREYLLLLSDNAPLSQQRAYARVHSHELAHQWFGNLVTPVWWEDIWLNEAFATWMGNKALTLWKPDGGFDNTTLQASLGAMNIDTLSTTRKVREPLERSENVMDQFDGITYRKGGGVLSMFESYVGEDNFRKGVRLHMERYADDVATGDDFFQSIADGSGNASVVAAMKSFVDQPGLPLVSAKMSCDKPGTAESKTQLELSQSRYAPLGSKTKQGQSWQIPVCVTYGIEGGRGKECTLMTKRKTTLKLPTCTDWATLNNDGAGYYRFTMDSVAWGKLLSNIDALSDREVLTVQDSLLAAFRAGEVESSVLLKGMEAFAKHPSYEVASNAGGLLGFMHRHIPEAREDIAPLVQDMYKLRYTENLGQNTVEANLLNPSLASSLITRGGDETLRREFEAKGAAYLGLDGPADKKAVASNMLSRALREVMKARGEASEKPLLDLVKSGNSLEKGAAIGALGGTTDPRIAASLRELALSNKESMTGRQALSLVYGLMGNEKTADDTWEWAKTNFDQFVSERVADVRKGGMPSLAGNFCSLEKRDEAKAFFEKNANVIPGYERSLKQVTESIELCAALKSNKAEELRNALASR